MQLALAACLVCALAPMAAAETVTDRAKRLFEEAIALEDQGDPRACERFAESYQLVAAAGTAFNLAECMEDQGLLLRAWKLYLAAATDWDREGKDKRSVIARERAQGLEEKLATLIIEVENPTLEELRITVGERIITPASRIREVVDPGEIEVRAVAPGHPPYVTTVNLKAGATKRLRIELGGDGGDSGDGDGDGGRRNRLLLAAGLGGAGAVGVITGTVLFLGARDLQAQGEEARALRRADIATVVGLIGLGLVAGGIYAYVTAPSGVVVSPSATQDSTGIVISGTF